MNIRDVVIHGSTQNTQFKLGHIEPTAVFGRVVKLQLSLDSPCFLRREGLVQGSGSGGGQVVQDNPDQRSLWKNLIHQPFPEIRKVFLGVLLRQLNMPFVHQMYEQHVHVSDAVPLILIIDPFRRPAWVGIISGVSPIKARLHSS